MRSGLGLASLVVFGCAIAGCDTDSKEPPFSTAVRHDPEYRFRHGREATENPSSCTRCHGRDYNGTASAPSCFACHPPPGPPFALHPPSMEPSLPWWFPVNHGSEAKKDIRACQRCHGETGGRGSNPSFALPIRALERGCESAEGCHFDGSLGHGHNPRTAHPSLDSDDPSKQDLMHWYGERVAFVGGSGAEQVYLISHYNAGNLTGACALCHGSALDGGVGPACTDCHVLDPVANPGRCVSCHGAPVGAPEDLIREVRRTRELGANAVYRKFLGEVSKGFHLEHDTIACQDRDSVEDCRACHGTTPNADKHHDLVGAIIPEGVVAQVGRPGEEYECLTCHEAISNPTTGEPEFVVVRQCDACHDHPFPATVPCPE